MNVCTWGRRESDGDESVNKWNVNGKYGVSRHTTVKAFAVFLDSTPAYSIQTIHTLLSG